MLSQFSQSEEKLTHKVVIASDAIIEKLALDGCSVVIVT